MIIKGYTVTRQVRVLALLCMLCVSCHDYETYAEQKEDEKNAINAYIAKKGINVISESTFFAQDSMTDASKNEYVLFESSGVYMQIVHKGCGQKVKSGETVKVLSRFSEYNVVTDSLRLSNVTSLYSRYPEKMLVTNTNGTFTGSFFTDGNFDISLMSSAYSSTSVPAGWLIPFAYVNIGRPANETDQIAEVKLIVPHTQGHSYASQNVTPFFYSITFERGK